MLQVTDDLIRNVVSEVLATMKVVHAPTQNASGTWGVFDNVDDAVKAALKAQKQFEPLGYDGRKKATDCIRKICIDKAEMLGLEEMEHLGIVRIETRWLGHELIPDWTVAKV